MVCCCWKCPPPFNSEIKGVLKKFCLKIVGKTHRQLIDTHLEPNGYLNTVSPGLPSIYEYEDNDRYMYIDSQMGVSIVMGVPQFVDGLFQGEYQTKMDDNSGYPHGLETPKWLQ